METVTIQVEGMSCNHCKMAVEQGLQKIDGVKSAEVNLDAKNVTVGFEPGEVTVNDLKAAITDAGYEPQ